MVQSSPHSIDLTQPNTWQNVLPRSPILSSVTAGWQGIYLEYHQQPAHETPDYCLPTPLISIALGYQAKEFRADGRLYRDITPGNVAIRSAHQRLSTQAYGNAEFLLLAIDPVFFPKAAFEMVNAEEMELKTQIIGRDPLIYQMGLALKQELEVSGQDSRIYAEDYRSRCKL